MGSKMVDDRSVSFNQTSGHAKKYLPVIRASCDSTLAEGFGAKAADLIEQSLTVAGSFLVRIQAADSQVKLERHEAAQAFAHRDKCAEDCRNLLLPVRGTLTSIFGEPYATALGFVGPTPDQPTSILRLCTEVTDKVSKVAVPAPVIAGAAVDPVGVVLPLVEPAEKLNRAMEAVVAEEADANMVLNEKSRAIAGFDRSFSVAANLLSTFLDLAGERELARKVRPSVRRPGNTVEVAGGESTSELPLEEPTPVEPSTTVNAAANADG